MSEHHSDMCFCPCQNSNIETPFSPQSRMDKPLTHAAHPAGYVYCRRPDYPIEGNRRHPWTSLGLNPRNLQVRLLKILERLEHDI